MTTTKLKGTVAYWNAERGFGFIRRDAYQTTIFADISEVDDAYDHLTQGQSVEFAIADSKRKPGSSEAVEIDVIKGERP